MIKAICRVDHRETGGADAGWVVATFDSMQDASNRGIEESYPNCLLEYVEEGENLNV